MLAWIVAHSPWLMLGCCGLGLLWPQGSEAMLPFLPQVLFFLMCFSLLGLNQRQLWRALASRAVWGFALWHGAGYSALAGGLAFVLGARGDWLLAIAAVAATSPLFATGALAQSVGLPVLPAMARTIAATLLLPLVLLAVLAVLVGQGATIDLAAYAMKLLVYVAGPMVLAVVLRGALPERVLLAVYPRVAQYAVLLVFAFPFGLMAAFRYFFDDFGMWAALELLGVSTVLCFGGCVLAALPYGRAGQSAMLAAAIVGGSRNVLLTLAIAGPFLGERYLPLIGALQLPMFVMPLLVRFAVRRERDA